ncbi:MAG: zinc-ribbon domain-containing protein [Candidatus Limnocylindria bacterium]
MSTCATCGTENKEGARFCNACGSPMREAAALRESRKTVTVLFIHAARERLED